MNKKIVLAISIIVMAMLVYASGYMSGNISAYKGPPEVQNEGTIETTVTDTSASREIYLEDVDTGIFQSKVSNDCYGGIAGSENNPPQDTYIDESLTEYYNRPTATGNGETYLYISGWWFNLTQVAKLPSESRMYGISPCAITSGGSEGPTDGGHEDGDIDSPTNPVPELGTMTLVLIGLIVLFILYGKKR